jgi:hypothetical protein
VARKQGRARGRSQSLDLAEERAQTGRRPARECDRARSRRCAVGRPARRPPPSRRGRGCGSRGSQRGRPRPARRRSRARRLGRCRRRVGEHPPDGDRGVGGARRAGDQCVAPTAAGAVRARPVRASEKITRTRPSVAIASAIRCAGLGRGWVEMLIAQGEHAVGDDRAGDASGDLGRDVGERVSSAQPA